MSVDTKAIVRAEILAIHGTSHKQSVELVHSIISAFENPEKWPMTDTTRIALLREIYTKAKLIRKTEAVE